MAGSGGMGQDGTGWDRTRRDGTQQPLHAPPKAAAPAAPRRRRRSRPRPRAAGRPRPSSSSSSSFPVRTRGAGPSPSRTALCLRQPGPQAGRGAQPSRMGRYQCPSRTLCPHYLQCQSENTPWSVWPSKPCRAL
ncbi:uncharacterized protein ACIQIH_006426 [Cyanocitta cristata]